MSITLLAHNENAYHVALSMLKVRSKAAIIHPTGTGKSFIGFKFCEDFPEKRICWLSPSEYIFRSQLENLAADSGIVPKNIIFLTYVKLMVMDIEGKKNCGQTSLFWTSFTAVVRNNGALGYRLCSTRTPPFRCWAYPQRISVFWITSGIWQRSFSTDISRRRSRWAKPLRGAF